MALEENRAKAQNTLTKSLYKLALGSDPQYYHKLAACLDFEILWNQTEYTFDELFAHRCPCDHENMVLTPFLKAIAILLEFREAEAFPPDFTRLSILGILGKAAMFRDLEATCFYGDHIHKEMICTKYECQEWSIHEQIQDMAGKICESVGSICVQCL